MNHYASWTHNNVSTIRFKKGSSKQNAEHPLQRRSLWKEQRRFGSRQWGSQRRIPSRSQYRAALVELKEQSPGVKFWASFWLKRKEQKEEDTMKVFQFTLKGNCFFSFNKQVINSLQSQEGKSQAVCFHCMKSKLHFPPHLYCSHTMSEKKSGYWLQHLQH